jgi:hypothetical protein
MAMAREIVEDRVRFVFEDAQVRAFKADLLNVLEVVQLPDAQADALRAKLQRKAGSAASRIRVKRAATRAAGDLPTFKRQLAIFTHEFPGGFDDPRYLREERANEGGTDSQITRAQAELSRESFETAIATRSYERLYESARTLLHGGEDLFPALKARTKALQRDDRASFVRALNELLHGDSGDYEASFDAWVIAMRATPRASWPVATYLQALVHPGERVFIKRSYWCAQAQVLDMTEGSDVLPSGSAHQRFTELGLALNAKLVSEGHAPKDLWDAHSFVWRTLGPSRATRPSA